MMNPRTMEFEPETPDNPKPPDWKRYTVGQTFEVGGVLMIVHKILKKSLVLRPVK